MKCDICGGDTDLRQNVCFDCASMAEDKALEKNFFQHLCTCIKHIFSFDFHLANIDFQWALERITDTGDYSEKEKQERKLRNL